nr:cytochrome c oxidase subunit 2 [Pseudoanthomastus sp. ANT288]
MKIPLSALLEAMPLYDVAEPSQLSFQDAASPVMEEVLFLHNQIMFILIVIITIVLWLILRGLTGQAYYRYLVEEVTIEVVWTVIPAIILIFIAFPSLKLLYLMDEIVGSGVTVKAIGHQWYWSYEYSDYQTTPDKDNTLEFDSYMVPTIELELGGLRLLEVDNRMIVPVNTHIRVLVTGADVLHAFAVPSLGVKMDAVPGRLNQTGFLVKRQGIFYGQCSELCGANHSFMPIVIEAVSADKYTSWLYSLCADL